MKESKREAHRLGFTVQLHQYNGTGPLLRVELWRHLAIHKQPAAFKARVGNRGWYLVTTTRKCSTAEPWKAVLPLPIPELGLTALPIFMACIFIYTKHVSKADEDSARLMFWREKSSVVV